MQKPNKLVPELQFPEFLNAGRWQEKHLPEIRETANGLIKKSGRGLSWSHNLAIFSRCKSAEEREFYLTFSKKENYSFRQLERQISAGFFERTMIGSTKLSAVLRELQPDVNQVFKDNYVLEFLGLPEIHTENNLQKALLPLAQYPYQFVQVPLAQITWYHPVMCRLDKPLAVASYELEALVQGNTASFTENNEENE